MMKKFKVKKDIIYAKDIETVKKMLINPKTKVVEVRK